MPDPDFSQTLTNLSNQFPGSVTTPPPSPLTVSAEINALLNSPLTIGQKIAKISEIDPAINARLALLTSGGAPNTTNRQLATRNEILERSNVPIVLLNGFTQSTLTLTKNSINYIIRWTGAAPAAGAPLGTKILDFPTAIQTEFVRSSSDGRMLYSAGTSLWTLEAFPANAPINLACAINI